MAKIERFEEIRAWQLSRELVRKVYELSRGREISKDFGFKDQIQRAAVSVMSNIAEGFERFSKKEFAQFLNVARGSVAEVRSHLYVALDLQYVSREDFLSTKDLCETISRHLWNFMKYLRQGSRASTF